MDSMCFRVLERIGARALSAHLRKLCDYLAFEFTISGQNNLNISKLIDAVNSLMWKYNVVTLDRLVLCLVSWMGQILYFKFIEIFLIFFKFNNSICFQ